MVVASFTKRKKKNEGASVQESEARKNKQRVLGYIESFHFMRQRVSFGLDSLLRIGGPEPNAVAGRRVLCLGGGLAHA
jgi:hypothetical protein